MMLLSFILNTGKVVQIMNFINKNNSSSKSQEEKVKEAIEKLHSETKALFESDRYKQYLSVLSKFHNYSINNTLMIYSQRPDASYVAGYNDWKNKFDRQVEKGAKGIQIIQPAPYKKQIETEMKDGNGNPVLGYDGKVLTHIEEVVVNGFKVGHVFAYEDTTGTPLPSLVSELTESVSNYNEIIDVIKTACPVQITFEPINSSCNGYFHLETNDIHVKENMSESQTIKTIIHEWAHNVLHAKDTGTDQDTDKRSREVEAESVAYAVCSYLGLDTSDYSFGYIAGWSQDKELKELQEHLKQIHDTAHTIINKITNELEIREINRADELAFKLPESYLLVQKCDYGYNYNFYDRDFSLLCSGIISVSHDMQDAVNEACKIEGRTLLMANPYNCDSLREKVSEKAKDLIKYARCSVSFYTYECGEYPTMGDAYEDLTVEDAITLYNSYNKAYVPIIGITYHNPDSFYDNMQIQVYPFENFNKEFIENNDELKNCPQIKEALETLKEQLHKLEINKTYRKGGRSA